MNPIDMPCYKDIVAVVESLISHRDAFNHHGPRVSVQSMNLAQEAGLSIREIEMIGVGASLHDIGKISVDSEILNSPRKLAANEYARVKVHAREGWRVLQSLGYDPIILDVVLHHHENWDGSGYPDSIGGEQISIYARMVRITDVYDALTHLRPHRMMMSPELAEQQMQELSGMWFDPKLLNLFFEKIIKKHSEQ